MIDYNKLKEHELKMLTNQEGYMKFEKLSLIVYCFKNKRWYNSAG